MMCDGNYFPYCTVRSIDLLKFPGNEPTWWLILLCRVPDFTKSSYTCEQNGSRNAANFGRQVIPLPSNRHHRSYGDRLEGKGKTIRSVLCNIVCNNCAQCDAHTYEQTSTVLWIGFCLTGPISLCLDSFLHVLCVLLYTVCTCRFVTRWGGPGGIEAYP